MKLKSTLTQTGSLSHTHVHLKNLTVGLMAGTPTFPNQSLSSNYKQSFGCCALTSAYAGTISSQGLIYCSG